MSVLGPGLRSSQGQVFVLGPGLRSSQGQVFVLGLGLRSSQGQGVFLLALFTLQVQLLQNEQFTKR